MKHLDARSEWVADTRELRRTPGAMQRIERTMSAPADLGTEIISVSVGEPVRVSLRLESVMEGVLVSGSIRTKATGECVRCLGDVAITVDADVQELFAYADRAAHHRDVASSTDEDEIMVLDGDLLDLVPLVRDAVVTSLPYQPVCRPDCPGLCDQCGEPLADNPHTHEERDPRWAALEALTNDTEKRN